MNNATFHARLSKLSVVSNNSRQVLVGGLLGYVTPQDQEMFTLNSAIMAGQVVEVDVNGVLINLTVLEASYVRE